ncbi:MAG: ABC transporter permease [Marinifilaceae bacterium]
MNTELFIARRLLREQTGKSVSLRIMNIALIGIILGVAVMLLSIFITIGFKKEIISKLSGFVADIEITAYYPDNTAFQGVVELSDTLIKRIETTPGVTHYYPFVTKPAILKSKDEIQGIVMRGVDNRYDSDFFAAHLVDGELPDFSSAERSDDILISNEMASVLKLSTGDKVQAHFVQEPPRVRQLNVKGIYNTGFKEYDDVMVMVDMRHLQRLNSWSPNMVSGVAVNIADKDKMLETAEILAESLPYDRNNNYYRVTPLQMQAPQIYDWLAMLNTNIWIILILLAVVAGFNMVSGLLVLIIDRSTMIGVLKTLGMKDKALARLFLYISVGLIVRGVLIGTAIAVALGWAQQHFQFIKLDPTSYYMDTVPIYIDWLQVALLDIGVIFVSTLMLLVPTLLVARVNPIEVIKFE